MGSGCRQSISTNQQAPDAPVYHQVDDQSFAGFNVGCCIAFGGVPNRWRGKLSEPHALAPSKRCRLLLNCPRRWGYRCGRTLRCGSAVGTSSRAARMHFPQMCVGVAHSGDRQTYNDAHLSAAVLGSWITSGHGDQTRVLITVVEFRAFAPFLDPASMVPRWGIAREPADRRGDTHRCSASRRGCLRSGFHAGNVLWLSTAVGGLSHCIRHFRIIAALDQTGTHRSPRLPHPRIRSIAYRNPGNTTGTECFDPDAAGR